MIEKPGYKTTEFWLSMAAILVGALMASGALPAESTALKIAGIIASVLGAMGYTMARGIVKGSATKANGLMSLSVPIKSDPEKPANP